MTIARIEGLAPLAPPEGIGGIEPLTKPGEAGGATGATSFEGLLGAAIHQVDQSDFEASQKVQALAAGRIDDLHGTMIAVKEADISMKLVGTVRNKILDAFQELWKTSV